MPVSAVTSAKCMYINVEMAFGTVMDSGNEVELCVPEDVALQATLEMLRSRYNKDVIVFTHWYHAPDSYNQMVKDHLFVRSVHKGYQVVAVLSSCIPQAPPTKRVRFDF